jgi:myb proto-oncogene protein
MDFHVRDCVSEKHVSEEDMEIRRGPWTAEEDSLLMNHITLHGEGRWNSVARSAGN